MDTTQTTTETEATTPDNRPTGGRGKPRGPRGRFVSPTLPRVEELVAQGTTRPVSCGLPDARRNGLIREWAKLTAMIENLDRFVGSRLLTGRFKLRVPYRRQLDFEKRIERIEERLGWDVPNRKPAVPSRVMRTLSPAARERLQS
jgi:hypothetical protein